MATVRHTCVTLALWSCVAMTGTHAQVFRSSVDAVTVDVSVMRDGVAVAGLQAADFQLEDNGARQELSSVTQDSVPLHVSLVLDTSASVSGERLNRLTYAANALLDHLRAEDRTSLITFSQEVRLRTSEAALHSETRAALEGLVGTGSTSLRDGVQLALSLTANARTRSLLLVFSDGADTMSWLSEEDVLDTARRSAGVVHVVRFNGNEFLDRIADATGGRSWAAQSDTQLAQLFTQALEEMRARYVLTYTPARTPAKGWHAIKVSLKDRGSVVTARPGYFVAGP